MLPRVEGAFALQQHSSIVQMWWLFLKVDGDKTRRTAERVWHLAFKASRQVAVHLGDVRAGHEHLAKPEHISQPLGGATLQGADDHVVVTARWEIALHLCTHPDYP